jgi:hypothetical protein
MRRILLVLIGLACAIPVAEAAPRDGRQGQTASRSAQQATRTVQPARQVARPQTSRQQASRQQASRQQASRQQVSRRQAARQPASHRRAALRPGDVRTQRDGVAARGAAAARVPRRAVSSIAGWQRGLPVANYAQRECPAGTLATLARGHDDVVRCMPL